MDDTNLPPLDLPAPPQADPPLAGAESPAPDKSQADWGIGQVTMSPLGEASPLPEAESAPQPGPPEPPVPTVPDQSTAMSAGAAPAAPTEETLVIPPAGSPAANPFIPQGTAPSGTPPAAGPLNKRIMTILAVIVVLILVGIGGWFAFNRYSPSAPSTITYWGLWEDNATIQTMLSDFETQYPNIKVQYVQQSPKQYRERLQAAVARGDGPDVFEFHNTWVPMLANELMPAPATVMTPSQFTGLFYPVAAADLVGGSSVYGIPMMIDGLGLYYNTDLLSAAGVSPPTTWPELLDLVPKLTVKTDTQIQKSAIALGTTGNIENFSDIVALMMMQNGATLINPTGKEAEDSLTFYRKFSNPSDPDYTWNDSMDNSVYAFATGEVAMIIAPSWRVFDIKQISPKLNFKIVSVPQLPGNTINWATYWVEGVSSKTKNSDAAWKFVTYLTSKATVTKLFATEAKSRLFGEPYALISLGSSLASDPYLGAYISAAPSAKSFPLASRTYDDGLNDKLIKYLTDAVNSVSQGNAPTQALSTMSQGFAQVLSSYGLSAGASASPTP